MKRLLTIISISALITSCAPGRWTAGNDQHFAQRAMRKAAVKVTPDQPIAFKKIDGKFIVLTEKPAQEDLITISVKKGNNE